MSKDSTKNTDGLSEELVHVIVFVQTSTIHNKIK